MTEQFPGQPIPGQSNPWGPPAQQSGSLDPETGMAWPTDRCMVTVGFYTLGRCGATAAGVCSSCGRGVCGAHIFQVGGRPVCLACRAESSREAGDPLYDNNWATRYRRQYREGAARRYNDDRLFWSFNHYDTHYVSHRTYDDDWNDYDHDVDMYDS